MGMTKRLPDPSIYFTNLHSEPFISYSSRFNNTFRITGTLEMVILICFIFLYLDELYFQNS